MLNKWGYFKFHPRGMTNAEESSVVWRNLIRDLNIWIARDSFKIVYKQLPHVVKTLDIQFRKY